MEEEQEELIKDLINENKFLNSKIKMLETKLE